MQICLKNRSSVALTQRIRLSLHYSMTGFHLTRWVQVSQINDNICRIWKRFRYSKDLTVVNLLNISHICKHLDIQKIQIWGIFEIISHIWKRFIHSKNFAPVNICHICKRFSYLEDSTVVSLLNISHISWMFLTSAKIQTFKRFHYQKMQF